MVHNALLSQEFMIIILRDYLDSRWVPRMTIIWFSIQCMAECMYVGRLSLWHVYCEVVAWHKCYLRGNTLLRMPRAEITALR